MNDMETVKALLKKIHIKPELLNIFDGSLELSFPVEDLLNMKRVFIEFNFTAEGDLNWIDVEVR